ncbi:MAG: hypothetical protein ABSD63_11660 [Candidatus Korobacteraceae bacterium]|jgi:formyltetrahydrofolate hydrolase
MKTAVLLLSCPGMLARQGVVAAISNFITAHHGGVLHSDDHPLARRALAPGESGAHLRKQDGSV